MSRRCFPGAAAAIAPKPGSAANRVNVAVVGLRGRGKALAGSFVNVPDWSIEALVDADASVLEQVSAGVAKQAGTAAALAWDLERERAATNDRLDARKRDVRRRVREMIGPLPPAAPARAAVTGAVERDRRRIDKLLHGSRPGLRVSGNLQIPCGEGPFLAHQRPEALTADRLRRWLFTPCVREDQNE